MFLQHRQYLALLDQIQYLKKDNSLLKQQNSILTQQLINQKSKNLSLHNLHQQNIKLIQQLHNKSINNQTDNANIIIQKMNQFNKSTKNFLQDKFKLLQTSTSDQAKQIQIKHTKNKLDLYQLTDFFNHIKTLYKESQSQSCQTSQNKKITSHQLTKWIKSITMNLTKHNIGLTASMSAKSMNKNGKRSSKLKQNQSLLNCLQSKTKIINLDKELSKNQI